MSLLAQAQVQAPDVDFAALAPLIAVAGGSVVVLMVGLLRGAFAERVLVPLVTVASLLATLVAVALHWTTGDVEPTLAGTLSFDALTLGLTALFCVAGIATVALSHRSEAVEEAGAGEYYSLLLGSIAGMVVLVAAEDLVTLFIGLELLSIPLYVLCGSLVTRATSLESGLKYLVIGSVGSATLLYGLALVYGATGATRFVDIADAIDTGGAGDPLLLTGVALVATGLAFKGSVAPFHQWTPDVYEGAPTPVTAFMAVATKAAAFGVFLRLFDSALPTLQLEWGPALAVLAVTTIVIGNVGAIAQDSLKRMLAWSGVAQAGYLLAGVVVGTQLGVRATVFYLAVYTFMNVAAFAVVIVRERATEHGDTIGSVEGLGAASPVLAWCMTIAMLALAGFPATGGFIGKFYLISATVEGRYTWLGVAIVIGSMISLVYYLRVVAAMWMTPRGVEAPGAGVGAVAAGARPLSPVGGGSPEADARAQPERTLVAVVMTALVVLTGLLPAPLFELARDAGTSFPSIV
jgi:NADH-quinone oxidoreductase subunit N